MDQNIIDVLKTILQQRFDDLIDRRNTTNKITYWVGALFIVMGGGILHYQENLKGLNWFYGVLAFLVLMLTIFTIIVLCHNFGRYKEIYMEVGKIYEALGLYENNLLRDPRNVGSNYTILYFILSVSLIAATLIIYLIYKGCSCHY